MNIHPLAIVHAQAQIGKDVTIGPFAVIEADVVIDEGCRIAAHVVIKNGTRLGPGNEVCEAAILGGHPQHLKKPEQLGKLLIGTQNIIREHATLHRSMKPETATIVGDHNLLMAGAHVRRLSASRAATSSWQTTCFWPVTSLSLTAFVSGGVGVTSSAGSVAWR